MAKEHFEITVNKKQTVQLSKEDLPKKDLIQLGKEYHLIEEGSSYSATILNVDLASKLISLEIDGKPFEVKISDRYDQLIEKLGLNINIVHKINEITAPMPGMVLKIEVQPGDEIQQGDPLIVLEAMKMENVIKSHGEGRVKSILATNGKAVEKGEILIELE